MTQKIDEANLLALFEQDPKAFEANASLCKLAQETILDPWGQAKFLGTRVWNERFAESTAAFHLKIESWLQKKYNLSVTEDERWDSDRKTWISALFYQAKKKRSHPAALSAITLLSLGTDSINDVMNANKPYSLAFDFKKKSWNYEFGQRALEELAKNFEGGSELVKQLSTPDDHRAALEALWQKAQASESDLEMLRAFAFLKMAFGENSYAVLTRLRSQFPDGFVF